ncbi:MAG: DUF302 domain-containing protein [Gammaproteobacteria bacterium]|nr:DUF302 domain-containing protein [Gammaproteobacteria bacterium]
MTIRTTHTNSWIHRAALGVLVISSVLAPPTFAGEGHFVRVVSRHPFAGTVGALKKAVARNHMMVMGQVNQSKVLAMTGLRLQGEAFLVGNPVMGKNAFRVDPAAGAVLPARIYVWTQGANTYIGYFEPSSLLTQISPRLGMMGGLLNKKFARVAREAAR